MPPRAAWRSAIKSRSYQATNRDEHPTPRRRMFAYLASAGFEVDYQDSADAV